jgi:hypothetical protein
MAQSAIDFLHGSSQGIPTEKVATFPGARPDCELKDCVFKNERTRLHDFKTLAPCTPILNYFGYREGVVRHARPIGLDNPVKLGSRRTSGCGRAVLGSNRCRRRVLGSARGTTKNRADSNRPSKYLGARKREASGGAQ